MRRFVVSRCICVSSLYSEREPELQFEAAVIGSFGKSRKAGSACRLIRAPEQWRCDVANDRTGIRVVEQIHHLHRDGERVGAPGLPSACGFRGLGTEFHSFAEVRVEENRPWAAAVIPMQNSVAGRWIGIKQTVDGWNDVSLVWVGSNARSSIEQRRSIDVAAGGDIERRTRRDVDQRAEYDIPFCSDRPTQRHAVTDVR